MNELGTSEVSEMQKVQVEGFKNIKPESSMSPNDAKAYLDKVFDSQNDGGQNKSENRIYLDDNGNEYRSGNDLKPNNQYEINGYKYSTDDEGRITAAEGKLHMKEHDGRLPMNDSISVIGKGFEKETDDRGHLIGDQFGGSGGMENMIPQDSSINRGSYKNLENQLANEVKAGNDVSVKVEPVYVDDSKRPDAVVVTSTINGIESMQIFPNERSTT